MACPFCYPEDNEEQQITLENEHARFLQKPQVALKGSGVIVPRRHRATVFDLTRAEWNAMYDLLQEAKALLDRRHRPDGYNVGWNAGETAGQDIPHAHLHVLPRYKYEPLAGKGIRYWLKQEIDRIS